MNITKPINFFAQKVHGITKNMLQEYDYIDTYIDDILAHIQQSEYVIGHNIAFDIRMLKQDCERIGKSHNLGNVQTFCTMRDTAHVVGLEGKKRPKLGMLYEHLFGKGFAHAHDAMADIQATKDCFVELVKRGVVRI